MTRDGIGSILDDLLDPAAAILGRRPLPKPRVQRRSGGVGPAPKFGPAEEAWVVDQRRAGRSVEQIRVDFPAIHGRTMSTGVIRTILRGEYRR